MIVRKYHLLLITYRDINDLPEQRLLYPDFNPSLTAAARSKKVKKKFPGPDYLFEIPP